VLGQIRYGYGDRTHLCADRRKPKQALALQIAEAMKAQNLSRKRLAERMKTSRSQISRLLDPKDGNVTITTLQRAAKIVGRTLRVELV
jgi:antitoxin HicB